MSCQQLATVSLGIRRSLISYIPIKVIQKKLPLFNQGFKEYLWLWINFLIKKNISKSFNQSKGIGGSLLM